MILHNYNDLAGTTQFWDTSDSFEQYQRNLADPAQRARLEQHGHVDSVIEYRFNSEGFRGSEIDNPECVCFGCSFTMGTGVSEDEAWPNQFAKLSGRTTANLGHAGSSNDTAVRFALHYIPLLKPQVAVWVQTDPHRLEIINQGINIVDNILAGSVDGTPYKNDVYVKQWIASGINQDLNLIKNTLSFRQICADHQVQCVIVPNQRVHEINDRAARDLMHPSKNVQKKLAEIVSQLV
jgi:hypothetical protein